MPRVHVPCPPPLREASPLLLSPSPLSPLQRPPSPSSAHSAFAPDAVCAAAAAAHAWQVLGLAWCGMQDAGAATMAEALKANQGLVSREGGGETAHPRSYAPAALPSCPLVPTFAAEATVSALFGRSPRLRPCVRACMRACPAPASCARRSTWTCRATPSRWRAHGCWRTASPRPPRSRPSRWTTTTSGRREARWGRMQWRWGDRGVAGKGGGADGQGGQRCTLGPAL